MLPRPQTAQNCHAQIFEPFFDLFLNFIGTIFKFVLILFPNINRDPREMKFRVRSHLLSNGYLIVGELDYSILSFFYYNFIY